MTTKASRKSARPIAQGNGLWDKAFLAALRRNGVVTSACDAASVGRRTVYDRRAIDPAFAADWEDALEEARDRIEAEAIRRAVDGYDAPQWYQGELVGTNREYSDSLMQMVLKGAKPDKYRERVSLDVNIDLKAFIADLKAAGIDPDTYFAKAQERIRLLPKTGTSE